MSLRSHLTTPLRQVAEDLRDLVRGRRERSTLGVTYHNFWSLPPTEETWFYRFLQRPAFRDLPHPPGINFFSVFGRRRLVKIVSGPKIFFTGEHLANYPDYHDHLLGEVDLALGFATLNDDHYLRFPLWLTDLFPPDADEAGIQARLDEMTEAGRDLVSRSNYAALIARHDNNGLRAELADILEAFGQVDYPGKFRNNFSRNLGLGYTEKIRLLRDYRFNICPENTNAPGYVTEKIWHAHAAGCIPVYWGSGNQPEPEILNPEAILFFDPADPERLSDQLRTLTGDQSALQRFAEQPRFLPGSAAAITGFYDRLEERLLVVLRK